MRLERLSTEIGKIKALLDDPQEGLMSWNMELADRMNSLVREWQGTRRDSDGSGRRSCGKKAGEDPGDGTGAVDPRILCG